MDFGTALTVAQTLFAALQCSQLKELCSFLKYEPELKNLQDTVATVKAVLLDAEAKQQELSHQALKYIEELKDAIYDADDLLDEFVTVAERKQMQDIEGEKVSKKVRHFFSRFKDLGVAYNMSKGIKEIRKKLDAIASNHDKFGFKIDSRPIVKRREETCSYVYAQDIVGREDDVEKIVGQLLDSNVDQQVVSILTIVGIGGLGKTALAQLVYNDERVTKHFSLRSWACVSDEDQKNLDMKAILSKILESATSKKHDASSMDVLQGQLRQELDGKKCLIILDDVWNENRDAWLKLQTFLMGCVKGSWVVVTTRSKETARIVDGGHMYELQGLSQKDSWLLFKRIAFGLPVGQANPSDLVEIGKKIVKKCANVPLAIRVVGSLLYGQRKEKWQAVLDIGLAEIRKDGNGILHILKLSYDNLESQLKSCFSYCALFPKDYRMSKELLLYLWMAQGYIVPFGEGQSVEDAAEEYFLILLRRSFFQDVEKDKYSDDILSCKMHDLMHDVAQEVTEKEVCVANSVTSNMDIKTRHISLVQWDKCTKESFPYTKIRTFLLLSDWNINLLKCISFEKWRCLRTLSLRFSFIKTLPDTIGKLLHLRYLDLSCNTELEVLPKSITKLINLQLLYLRSCCTLKELPNDLSKLVKLTALDIWNCNGLTHMPSGIGKLSCLQMLTMFVLGDEANTSSKQGIVHQLEDLKALTNLKDYLEIRIPKSAAYVKGNGSDEGGYLRSKQHLNYICFKWEDKESEGRGDYAEALIEELQPHPNLKGLTMEWYPGMRIPSWMQKQKFETFLPHLIRLSLSNCHGLQYLSSLGKLCCLRYLWVMDLMNLEYMENTGRGGSNSSSSEHSITSDGADLEFFPSLEELVLVRLPKLKGWWREDDEDDSITQLPSFPHLSKLSIMDCPELRCIPLCPSVEDLELISFNEKLQVMKKTGMGRGDEKEEHTCSSSKLRKVETNNVRGLMTVLPMEAFHCLTSLEIEEDYESLEEDVQELLQTCSSSLKSLQISTCGDLSLNDEKEEEDLDDDSINININVLVNLHTLALVNLPKLTKLPKGMQYLTSLQSLNIQGCEALESMPEWMPRLTSLTRLEVTRCSEGLLQRCQCPTGEDWPHIQHIPHLKVTTDWPHYP